MDIDPNLVIDRLGGTSAVAKICECKPPSVHQWRTDGIPKPRIQYLRLAYPEVFKEIEGTCGNAPAPTESTEQAAA